VEQKGGNLLKAALWYAKNGYSVIPLKDNKKPYVKWTVYQKEKPEIKQLTRWWGKWPQANIGLVTGEISNLIVIDIDLYKRKEALDEMQALIPENLEFPIAKSPQGGQHWYFAYQNGLQNVSDVLPNIDIRTDGGYITAPPSQISTGKYAWFEGLKISDLDLIAIPKNLYILLYNNCKKYAKNNLSLSTSCPQKSTNVLTFGEGSRDQDLFHVANCLVKGKMQIHNIQKTLQLLAQKCDPPFSPKEANEKIKSALERAEKKEINLTEEVKEFVLSTSGHFLSTEVYSCLQLSTRHQKKNVSTIMKRLVEEGLIEKYGNKNGHWRKIEQDIETIDWTKEEGEILDVKYPLGIEKYFKTMPKNIICIAGSPDAGKTALMLNFVKLNMYKHKIFYFSSEMSNTEFRDRLQNFDDIGIQDWNFKAFERSNNFADIIMPDDINIIDFLEVADSFWEVGKMLTDIYNKLKKGIALGAMQKNKGADLGRGATFSLEKPRLYLTVDPDFPGAVIKIVKCKNWRIPQINPNGLQCKFKLVGGANIHMTEEWERKK